MELHEMLLFSSYQDCNGVVDDYHRTTVPLIRVKVGTSNKLWREQIRAHINATTSFEGVRQSISVPPSYWNTTGTIRCFSQNGPILPFKAFHFGDFYGLTGSSFPAAPVVGSTNAASRALGSFQNKARGVTRHFNGGEFLGELMETVRMIRSPMRSLRNAFSGYLENLKRGYRIPRRHRDRFVADTWLEAQFGIRPLIRDISDGVKALQSLPDSNLEHVVRVRAKITELSDLGVYEYLGYLGHVGEHQFTIHRRDFFKESSCYYGGVWGGVVGSKEALARHFGISLDDAVITLYNLIPLSFVLDYFSNLSEIIEAYTSGNLKLAWVALTTRSSTNRIFSGTPLPFGGGGDLTIISDIPEIASSTLTYSIIQRAPVSGLDVPTLRFKLPGFSLKWLNLAALVSSSREVSSRLRL